MENPPSILVTPMAPAMSAQFTRITFSNLFVRRAGPGSTELTVEGRPSDQLGRRNLTDSPVFDGRGPDASLVARVQGVATQMGDVRQLYTVVFQERYICTCVYAQASCVYTMVLVLLISFMHACISSGRSRAPRSSPKAR